VTVFVVLTHPEHQSFNGAMYRLAVETFTAVGHEVRTSDLYAMQFNPVSSRQNFISIKDPDYFKPQIEERYATEAYGFADDVESEIQKLEWCDLMIWQFPLWWFGLPGILKGWVDRVFAMGRTYGGERLYANGVFRGKRAMHRSRPADRRPSMRRAASTVTSWRSCGRSSVECCSSWVSTSLRRRSPMDRCGWNRASEPSFSPRMPSG
jgi:putative NADPH-quinone reductase